MSIETVILGDKYVVTGISTEDQQLRYLGTDSNSGYPYWSSHFTSAVLYDFDKLDRAIHAFEEATTTSFLRDKVTLPRIGIVRTSINLDEISTEDLDAKRREVALAKLSPEERRLLGIK